ncbi:hypothetical protein IEQ34_026582 [Dendrobium chrysotoxum]|uniref:Uncharacterized protein n=1 Tax=Dendrobium chrysotoxum TaxID=161865 RepID=A0AAV7FM38_DENCH|nr:hypothetical protein IEQ34_026582 [Dendrobium chrysotoxum]
MPPGTRIHIEVNENNIPCNISESILLGTYLGVVARDPVLAPIAFPDWRNKGMEPFKKKMLAEVESKFEFPGQIRHWILQSLGVKWRNYKTTLKAEHWDSRSIEKILETVPAGVEQMKWCQLVNQWSKPEDKERAAKNSANAKKQTCPHTMGRVSSVRRQKETSIKDRLQLWKINRMRKDGTWSSEDAIQRWTHACNLLAEEGLTPEDGNIEANERVFTIVVGTEHSGRVRTQEFGVTPTRYFPQSKSEEGGGSGSNFGQIASLREEFKSFRDNQMRDFGSFRDEMRQFMKQFQMNQPPNGGSEMVFSSAAQARPAVETSPALADRGPANNSARTRGRRPTGFVRARDPGRIQHSPTPPRRGGAHARDLDSSAPPSLANRDLALAIPPALANRTPPSLAIPHSRTLLALATRTLPVLALLQRFSH